MARVAFFSDHRTRELTTRHYKNMLTLKTKNKRAVIAWGDTFLNFHMRWIMKLANDKQVDLWEELLKVDAEEDILKKVAIMDNLLERLQK